MKKDFNLSLDLTNEFSKTKLLIVDDSSNNRAAINYWLEDENYHILHASDGHSALKIVQAFIPDIILLDYNLPDIDGIEVCQKIRQSDRLPFIPIIMMSSCSPEAYVMALEQGADEFIVMPILPTELKSKLKAMLRLKKAVSDSIELSKQNKKLQELDKIKSNFVSKVSHELKTPLQAILGYADILTEGLQGELNYPQKLMIKQIKEGGEQLLRLITQLLDFERIEKGHSIFVKEVISVETVFKHVAQVMKPIANKKNINLVFSIQKRDLNLFSDKNTINNILINLISNAIKFSNQGSEVNVSSREILGECIEFKIQDSGTGIQNADMQNIFNEFWQGDDSITRSYGGLGIGLTLVKKSVTALGGHVLVESIPGKGSVFTVKFPTQPTQKGNPLPVAV